MSYEVGTHIDLSYLNHKTEVAPQVQKKSDFQEAASTLFEVGTQFVFNQAQQKLARRIPVSYA
jgi:hypothetical protein